MKEIDEYLERKGAKYFVAGLMAFYVLGAIIFNVYLGLLGIFEFEVVQLRYMFIGAVFVGFWAGAIFLAFGGAKFFWRGKNKKSIEKSKKTFKKWTERAVLILILPTLFAYSYFVFPLIPAGFGGGKPFFARLIGTQENIRRINELIAYETKIPVENLAFELATENSQLAIGANVQILARNSSRIFLVLTPELYLQSTSHLAKNLLESGTKFETEQTKNFETKPLIIDSQNVTGITLSLFSPPEVLTQKDLEIAAEILTKDPQNTEKVVQQIFETEREKTPKIQAAISEIQQIDQKSPEKITEILNKNFDQSFLDFRREIFEKSLWLSDFEKFNGVDADERKFLAEQVLEGLEKNFPDKFSQLNPQNFLITQLQSAHFPQNLSRIFRGADGVSHLIDRLNSANFWEQVRTFSGSGFSATGSGVD